MHDQSFNVFCIEGIRKETDFIFTITLNINVVMIKLIEF